MEQLPYAPTRPRGPVGSRSGGEGRSGARRLSPTPDFLASCLHSASRAPVLCEGPVLSWQRTGHEGIFTFWETAGERLIDRGSLAPQRPALTPYPHPCL